MRALALVFALVLMTGCGDPFSAGSARLPFGVGSVRLPVAGPRVAAGGRHSCAITTAGRTLCWGSGTNGQLGDGASSTSVLPVLVPSPDDFVVLTAGSVHTCALRRDREARCWGDNGSGQLGDSSVDGSTVPTSVWGGHRFSALSGTGNTSCGVEAEFRVRCWGSNQYGGAGGDTSLVALVVPELVPVDDRFAVVATGYGRACAIAWDGTTWCWGLNLLGIADSIPVYSSPRPSRLASAPAAVEITLGPAFGCLLTRTGATRCWGMGGALGMGPLIDSLNPQQPLADGHRFTSLVVGAAYACGLKATGSVLCWGENEYGQLGDSTFLPRTVPAAVHGTARYSAIAAGHFHTCAVTTTGSLHCWGRNTEGQLGDGTRSTRSFPAPVSSGESFAAPPGNR